MTAIRLEPELVEAVITAELEQNETVGDGGLSREFHSLANPLYERVPPEERERAFDRIYMQYFERLGFLGLLSATWAEFPDLDLSARGLLVLKAKGKHEEGAVIGKDGESVCLRILPYRFSNRRRLIAFLRHELLHAADMLNPAWGYHLGSHSDREADRYRALWCASIDSRLALRGQEPLLSRQAHSGDLDKQFGSLPEAKRAVLFDAVWKAEPLTSPEIMAITSEAEALSPRLGRRPGARCPLCGFPTHSWATGIEPAVAAVIRMDFPDWQLEDGSCGRCVERYRLVQSSLTE